MLTVIRESAAAAVATAERENDISAVLAGATDGAERALARTRACCRCFATRGVVDSGGAGLVRLLEGALHYLRGDAPAPLRRVPAVPGPISAGIALGETGMATRRST